MKLLLACFIVIFSSGAQAQSAQQESTQQKGPGVSGGGSFVESDVYGLARAIAQQLREAEDILQSELNLDAGKLADQLESLKFQQWNVRDLNRDERTRPYHFVNNKTVEINVLAWGDSLVKSQVRYMLQMALESLELPVTYKRIKVLTTIAVPQLHTAILNSVIELNQLPQLKQTYRGPFVVDLKDDEPQIIVEFWSPYRDVVRYECRQTAIKPIFSLQIEFSTKQQMFDMNLRCYYKGFENDSNKALLIQSALHANESILNSPSNIVSEDRLDLSQFLYQRFQVNKKSDGSVELLHEEELGYALRRIKVVARPQ